MDHRNSRKRRSPVVATRIVVCLVLLTSAAVAQEQLPATELENGSESTPQETSQNQQQLSQSQQQQVSQNQETESLDLRQLGNVPDDVGALLQEADERIDAIFSAGPLTPLHDVWDDLTDRLDDSTGLDLGLNYTAIYQRADTSVRGPRDASGGDLDFFGRWKMFESQTHGPGALVFSSESRHRYSDIPPSRLNTGTAGGTVVGFGTQDFSLVQLYWEQGSYEDRFQVRVGEMDPALIWDGGRYVSANYAFFSPAFSDTLPMALPGAGLGVAGAVYPTRSTYITAGVHDANGQRTTAGFDTFFEEGEYFSAVELGWFSNVGETDEGLYHLTFWHIDSREKAGRPSDRGFALTAEQPVGCDGNLVPFLRYAYADRGLNGVRQNLSIGLGLEDMLGQNDDVIGMAASWEKPSNRTLGDQYVLETFYRFYITPHTHLTPDIQVVINPANAPGKDAVTVFGLRLRTLF
jgi:porin